MGKPKSQTEAAMQAKKATKATAPLAPAGKVLEAIVPQLADESRPASLARFVLNPDVQAGLTLTILNGKLPEVETEAFIDELAAQGKAVVAGDLGRGEAMLCAQAHTLDAIFNAMAERARRNMGEHMPAADAYMRLALRAQNQCRATWETLAEIKNPRAVAFVRQANISNGPQQVNNGAAPDTGHNASARPHTRPQETGNTQSKLLEAAHGERMDTRATRKAGGANPQLETVGAINRPKDGGG